MKKLKCWFKLLFQTKNTGPFALGRKSMVDRPWLFKLKYHSGYLSLKSFWRDKDAILETRLPWFWNNVLRLLTQVCFLPVLLVLIVYDLIKQPFTRHFRDGGTTLDWGWAILWDEE